MNNHAALAEEFGASFEELVAYAAQTPFTKEALRDCCLLLREYEHRASEQCPVEVASQENSRENSGQPARPSFALQHLLEPKLLTRVLRLSLTAYPGLAEMTFDPLLGRGEPS